VVRLPGNRTITSTHEGYLRLPHLSKQARKTHLFPNIQASLISVGQLCDSGCIATFDEDKVVVMFDNHVVLTGHRDYTTGMWQVQLPTNSATNHLHATADLPGPNLLQHAAHAAVTAESMPERIAFLHACAGSPAISSFCKAIDAGYYRTWPDLTLARVRQHLKEPPTATVQGHLDQQRRNLRSTKKKPKANKAYLLPGIDETPGDIQPKNSEERCNHIYVECQPISGQIYSDQPGQFLVASTSGHRYLMVAYDYDSNAILAEPMTSRTGPASLAAYKCIHQTLTLRGLRPKLQRLDIEASTALKQYMLDEGMDFQLTPAGTHRRNAAERAIRTLKNHFIAILCSNDPKFPLRLWDRLLPQVLTTLNLSRGSRINPKLSAYAQLNGAFDFNRTPMGPPGTRVLVHELPEARGTWAPHAVPGWYIGPAFEHYRCDRVYITKRPKSGSPTRSYGIRRTLPCQKHLPPMPPPLQPAISFTLCRIPIQLRPSRH